MVVHRTRPLTRRLGLMAALALVPLVVFACVPPVRDRYLLPMIVPAAVLAAHGLLHTLYRQDRADRIAHWLIGSHWALVAAIVLGVPLAGAIGWAGMRSLNGRPAFAWPLAAAAVVLGGAVLLAGVLRHRRQPAALLVSTVAVVLLAQCLLFWGQRHDKGNLSPVKAFASQLARAYPDAPVYVMGTRSPRDFAIYMNRLICPISDPSTLRPMDKPQILLVPTSWHSWIVRYSSISSPNRNRAGCT